MTSSCFFIVNFEQIAHLFLKKVSTNNFEQVNVLPEYYFITCYKYVKVRNVKVNVRNF